MKFFIFALSINLLFALLRVLYVLVYPLDLSPEEAQYWDWSRHLDLSYYSKPPMVAYLNFLSTSLLGDTELGVRITPILLSFLLSALVFLFVRGLFGDRVALISSILPNLFLGTSINSLLMTTDAPFIFFWAAAVMLIYHGVETNRLSIWLWVGVAAGLAFLSKYPAVFLLPLTLLYMLIARRDLLLSPKPYASLLPAVLLSLPVLAWNIQRDFVSFRHVSNLAEKGSHFPNWASLLDYLGGQALLLSGVPFLILLYGWWRAFRDKDRRLIFLTVYSLPVFLFFLTIALRKKVYDNWPGFGYFTGVILISVFMERLLVRSKTAFGGILIFCSFLTLLLHFTPLIDTFGLTKLLPPKRDPVKVMVGWEKLGKEVSRFYTGKELVFSPYYQLSAELAFYVEGKPRTFVYHFGRMTQYYLWEYMLPAFRGRDAIFVSHGGVPHAVKRHFKGSEFLKRVDVFWRGERIESFYIYRLRDFEGRFDDVPKGY